MNELGTHQTHIRSTRIASSSFFLFCINTGTETSLFGQANSHGPFSLCHWGCLDWVLEVKTRAKEKRIPQCVRVKDSAVGHLSFCLFGSVYFFFSLSRMVVVVVPESHRTLVHSADAMQLKPDDDTASPAVVETSKRVQNVQSSLSFIATDNVQAQQFLVEPLMVEAYNSSCLDSLIHLAAEQNLRKCI